MKNFIEEKHWGGVDTCAYLCRWGMEFNSEAA